MDDGSSVKTQPSRPVIAPGDEAMEVAHLLCRAGIDHASALWFQLMELGTQQACEWAERCSSSLAPLSARAAAVLGLRSLAASILSGAQEQDDASEEATAAEACLQVCAEAEPHEEHAGEPARPRRWGEGATPSRPVRPRLLQQTAGCC